VDAQNALRTKRQAWWALRQGFDGSLAGASPAAVLERAGWARSVGGVGPYLTIFARAGAGRAAVDQAAARLEIHELPAARSCTYLVPASDFALALKLAQPGSSRPRQQAAALGVTDKELDRLARAVVDCLDDVPRSPEEIRAETGSLSRSLGAAGKAKGLATTLPIVLGELQAAGEIRRVPVNGRLDQQRYNYVRWSPHPLKGVRLTPDEAAVELARRFFSWIGPARLREFQGFSALGVKASQAAVRPLGLQPIEPGSDLLLLPEHRAAWESFRMPDKPQYRLVSSLDAIQAARRNMADLLDEADMVRELFADKGMQTLGRLADLPAHAILDRGRMVGLWEYDVDARQIVWCSFIGSSRALREAVARMEAYVRDDLGDARSFSLDSPASRAPRLEMIHKLA